MNTFYENVDKFVETIEEFRICKASIKAPLFYDAITHLHRMTYQFSLTKLALEMGGLPSFPQRFKLDPPEIELCEIIRFAQMLTQTRDWKKYKTVVYIDICESSKFYVGYSDSSYLKEGAKTPYNTAKNRLNAHRDNGGGTSPTYWTHFYPVISCLVAFPGDYEDEDLMTLLVAKCVGKHNVRGGQWASGLEAQTFPKKSVHDIMKELTDRSLTTAPEEVAGDESDYKDDEPITYGKFVNVVPQEDSGDDETKNDDPEDSSDEE
jgi:hypothetical protein